MSEKSTRTYDLWIGKSACSHWAKTTTYKSVLFTQYLNKVNMNLILKKDLFPTGFEPVHSCVEELSASPRPQRSDRNIANFDKI